MGREPLPRHQDYFTFIEGWNSCQCTPTEFIQAAAAGKFRSQIFADWVVHVSKSEKAEATKSQPKPELFEDWLEVIPRDIRRALSSDQLSIKRGRILDGPNEGKFALFLEQTKYWGAVYVPKDDLERYRDTLPEPQNIGATPIQKDSPDVAKFGEREKESLLRTIGAMALYIAKHGSKGKAFKIGDEERPNVDAIVGAVLSMIEQQKDIETYGLSESSLQKRIGKGIELLNKK